jgi:hypothetical protein
MIFTLATGSLSSTARFQMFKLCPGVTITWGGVSETMTMFSETIIIADSFARLVCANNFKNVLMYEDMVQS